jgi:DinB superfamily
MEERIVAADPVADPQGYIRELLALLGGTDPVEVLEATPARFRERTRGLAPDVLARPPAPGEWSVEELLAHFWSAEIAAAFRWRLVLAQDRPRLVGYDQEAWARLARPPFAALLDAFAALRTANVALVGGTDEGLWDREGVHDERGPESFRRLVRLAAGHDRAHLAQLDQTIAAVGDQHG